MNDNQSSFIFYKSFYEAIKRIPGDYQLELYNAICMYSLEGEEPTNLSSIAEAIFILIKPNIDSAQKRYKASVENGKQGGRPKKETQEEPKQNLKKTQEKPKHKPNQNLNKDVDVDKDYDKDYDKDMDKDEDIDVEVELQKRFVECTGSTNLNAISECISYLKDFPIDVINIALIKTSEQNGGWKYAKTILNNWLKSGIDTIEKVKAEELKFKSNQKQKNKRQDSTFEQRDYNDEDFEKFYVN